MPFKSGSSKLGNLYLGLCQPTSKTCNYRPLSLKRTRTSSSVIGNWLFKLIINDLNMFNQGKFNAKWHKTRHDYAFWDPITIVFNGSYRKLFLRFRMFTFQSEIMDTKKVYLTGNNAVFWWLITEAMEKNRLSDRAR